MTENTSSPACAEQASSNADPAEIEKFSDLASRWWDLEGDFKPLHQINPLRLSFLMQQLRDKNKKLSECDVIDIGCGGGILSEAMAKSGAKVHGIDLADAALRVAELHASDANLKLSYECVSAEAHAQQESERYDVVTCLEMLEHVPDPASIVRSCASLAKPGALVFFSTLNSNTKSWLFAILGAEYILKLLPRGTHEHARFIKPSELSLWSRQAGLTLKAMTGLTYNPATRVYSLCDDVSVNYIIAFQKPHNADF